jgi:hypothetical protein
MLVNRTVVNEATHTKIASFGVRFLVPTVLSLSFQMRATEHSEALDGPPLASNLYSAN